MLQTFKYGKSSIELDIPAHAIPLKTKTPKCSITEELLEQTLLKTLPNTTDAYKNIGIVVADKTRLCDYPIYLPALVNALKQKGATKSNITFYIAYGTHAAQSDKESLNCYGKVYSEYAFIHHNGNDKSAFTTLGTTKRGTPIEIRKDIINSSMLITFGAISHHYFAGFGGGRKLLFPGLSDRKAVYHNHGLFLDNKNKTLNINCQPGLLNNNPIAEDLKEIDSHLPPKLSLHAILNNKGKVAEIHIGHNYTDFEKVCKKHHSYYSSEITDKYDLAVASSGGSPKDINFIQAHKSIHHAAAFVKDGGQLIIIAECINGIASDYFMKYFSMDGFSKAYKMLECNYEGNGGTALSLMLKTKRIKISIISALNKDVCTQIGITKYTQAKAQKAINEANGSIAFIKNASLLVKA